MTEGSPLKHIVWFAIPMLIGNLFQQLYNMVDSLVVGNFVGANALAAVGTCGSMNFLFFSLSSGLAIGIGIIVAQFFGAKDEKSVRSAIANSIYVVGGMGLIVTILGILIGPELLKLLNTPDSIIGDASIYIRTTCTGIIAISAYNTVASILRALGDSKTPLYFLILSSIVNVVLDLVFVLFFQLGVFGVALATVISQLISAVTCLIFAYRTLPYFHLSKEELKPDARIIKMSFRLGVPVALQNSMIAVSMMILQGVVNQFGETVMAAYTVVSRVEQLVQQPYTSLSTALTNYSGQNIGAGKVDRVRAGFRKSVLVALVFSLCLLPITYFFGEPIIGCFVKEPEVIAIGAKGLFINSLAYFGLGMIYVPRGVLNGCGDTGFSMINGIAEVVCRIGYSHILTSIPFLGYWGVWLTTAITWWTIGVVCLLRYASGIWCKKAVVQGQS